MNKILFVLFFAGLMYLNPVYADFSSWIVAPVPRKLDTKEDLIRLEIQTLNQNMQQDIIARNIYFLELAVALPYANPIKALIRITDEQQYQKYKYALMAHIYQRLAYEYTQYGQLFYKRNIYFFNDEFLEEYIEGYDIAEFYYQSAYKYRTMAAEQAQIAREIPGQLNENFDQSFIDLDHMIYFLTKNPLDYQYVFDKLFQELNENRDKARDLLAQQSSTLP